MELQISVLASDLEDFKESCKRYEIEIIDASSDGLKAEFIIKVKTAYVIYCLGYSMGMKAIAKR